MRCGYGQFNTSIKLVRAHRFSYELHFGKIPQGMFVCHKCDIPNCVNPEHLFLGTPKDNTQDCIRKGRFNHKGAPGNRNLEGKHWRLEVIGGIKKRIYYE